MKPARAGWLHVRRHDMGKPFTCSVCGMTTKRRSHFFWLVDIVLLFSGQAPNAGDGPVCQRCAPRWASALGQFLYVLIGVCLVLIIWQFAPSGGFP